MSHVLKLIFQSVVQNTIYHWYCQKTVCGNVYFDYFQFTWTKFTSFL